MPVSRRTFLRVLGGGAAITIFPLLGGCGEVENSVPSFAATPATDQGLAPLPERIITPTEELYKQYFRSIAQLDVDRWRFEVNGSVHTPISLTHADFLAMPQTSAVTTMECIGNVVGGTQIGNVEWSGVLWSELKSLYGGVLPLAVEWRFGCGDGYETTLPIERLERSDVLLAHSMNGELLPADHGAPLRIIIPGKYGQKQPKWLVSMTAIDQPELGFWEQRGWSNTAEVLLHSLVRQVQNKEVNNRADTANVPFGPLVIAGVALDGAQPISRVEVSTDDGATWNDAEINNPPTPYEWTLWQYLWQPAATGSYRVTARAYAADGSVQDLADRDGSDGKTQNFVARVVVE